jgi:N-acetylmuramoyl-L-alanine amidase
LQTHLYVWRFCQEHKLSRLTMKLSLMMALGLFAFVSTLGGSTSGVSAHASSVHCAKGDRVYMVGRGDTLGKIASRYHISWSTLAAYNHLARPNLIYHGQVICIRGGSPVPHKVSTRAVAVKSQIIARSPAPPVGYSNTYPYPACTWWADQRYYQIHKYFVPWHANAMAWQWTARARQYHWSVSTRPSLGAIVDMQPWFQGAYGGGHVAVVERILRGGTVIASSMSWGANPYVVVYMQVRPGPGITFINR